MGIRVCDFDKDKHDNVVYGKNSVLKGSSITAVPSSRFQCGSSCEFTNARILLEEGSVLEMGSSCKILGTIIVRSGSRISIGSGLVCNFDIRLEANEGGLIVVGNDCLFSNVEIYNSDMHSVFDVDSGARLNEAADVHIGDRVWLSQGVLILKGARLGNDTVVGARSLVNGQYACNTVLAGSPAKVIHQGVCWSREALSRMPLRFDEFFSIGEFKAAAVLYQNEKVIDWGLPFIEKYKSCDLSNDSIFYYTARAVYDSYFRNGSADSVVIQGVTIDLAFLRDVFEHVYRYVNRKNYVCGSYAYMANYRLGELDSALSLFTEILPLWPGIQKMRLH